MANTKGPAKAKSKRGFASLSPERRAEIAAKGGRAAHAKGTAHEFTSAEAQAAGRKGGLAHDSEHMARIGAKGGRARARKERAAATLDDGEE